MVHTSYTRLEGKITELAIDELCMALCAHGGEYTFPKDRLPRVKENFSREEIAIAKIYIKELSGAIMYDYLFFPYKGQPICERNIETLNPKEIGILLDCIEPAPGGTTGVYSYQILKEMVKLLCDSTKDGIHIMKIYNDFVDENGEHFPRKVARGTREAEPYVKEVFKAYRVKVGEKPCEEVDSPSEFIKVINENSGNGRLTFVLTEDKDGRLLRNEWVYLETIKF